MSVLEELENKVNEILSATDDRGYLKHRESTNLEYKESFSFGSIADYLKTFAAYSNASGGFIIFGVKNSPRVPIGIKRAKFDEIEIEKITTIISDYFSPHFNWNLGVVKVKRKWFGYFYIYESDEKPVICKKNSGKVLKSGTIYYRYRGQSKVIEFAELKKIYNELREKERKLWMSHIKRIGKIGPTNVAFLDLMDGEIQSDNLEGKLLLDSQLLEQMKDKFTFIEEGRFDENEGAPALKLVGTVQAADTIVSPNLDPDRDYPYIQKDLADELQIRPYDVQTLLWKYGLEDSKKHCLKVKISRSSYTKKYSKFTLKKLREILVENEDSLQSFLTGISKEYTKRNST